LLRMVVLYYPAGGEKVKPNLRKWKSTWAAKKKKNEQ